LGLQMLFRSRNRRLRSRVFRRRRAGRTRGLGRGNGLASIAHLLHGRTARATGEAGDTTQDNNEPEHRVPRH
jgi:hypothetical protein